MEKKQSRTWVAFMVCGLLFEVGPAFAATVVVDASYANSSLVLEDFSGAVDPATGRSADVTLGSISGGAATYNYAANHAGEGFVTFNPTATTFDPTVYKYMRTRLAIDRDDGSATTTLQVFPTPVVGGNFKGVVVDTGTTLSETTVDLSGLTVNGNGLRLDTFNYSNDATADAAVLDYLIVDRYRTLGIEFDLDGDLNGAAEKNSSVSVSAGALLGTSTSTDPQLNITSLGVDADIYKYAEIRMKADSGVAGLFWDTAAQDGGATFISFGANDGEYHTYVVDLTDEAGWTGDASFLRLDVTNADNVDYEVDYVRFMETIPEPATLGLFALTGSAILLIRRRFIG
jgi:hypothetical protein